ncbi:hypothetical protein PVAP13_8NG275402 [Panicum virgatum]|uniref:Uncharacterized protein n=1 Tax=Panicum virgatum TaxID=38727 RepID=A0A8T0P8S6_PANVG|nr:hypothetical protein PVAP13_8NG275402 [Panicum virgatum]
MSSFPRRRQLRPGCTSGLTGRDGCRAARLVGGGRQARKQSRRARWEQPSAPRAALGRHVCVEKPDAAPENVVSSFLLARPRSASGPAQHRLPPRLPPLPLPPFPHILSGSEPHSVDGGWRGGPCTRPAAAGLARHGCPPRRSTSGSGGTDRPAGAGAGASAAHQLSCSSAAPPTPSPSTFTAHGTDAEQRGGAAAAGARRAREVAGRGCGGRCTAGARAKRRGGWSATWACGRSTAWAERRRHGAAGAWVLPPPQAPPPPAQASPPPSCNEYGPI